ncbi:hypothetical protein UPYG_G00115350 [Umbra pygmaea]|uniref:NHS-like protein 2 n=1 Tax=Umbra pygmaea TaxID=75934 RepID=A0ABD0X4J9_UMBPY
MEHRTLMCTTQAWTGPEGSTFTPNWEGPSCQPTVIMSPCPDVVKSPCQHTANTAHPKFGSVISQSTGPNGSTSGLSVVVNAAGGRLERDSKMINTFPNEDTVLLDYSPEFRGRSFSAAAGSNPVASRRRCDSYVHLCPEDSSRDAGQDHTSQLSPNISPEHGSQRSRSRSIILRKTKRRPQPPARSVSLRRDSGPQLRDKRTKSLYIDRDAPLKDPFLPDLILISTPRTGENTGPEKSPSQPVETLVGQSGTNNGQQPAHVSSEQSSFQMPHPAVLTSEILGPDPLGCRMRPKSSSSPTSTRARTGRLRLSLELPVVTPVPDPVAVKPKVARRHSESSGSSGTGRTRQRLSSSMLVMPVVTQEDLSSVRLRSVSSSDSDKGLEGSPEVIREEEPELESESYLPLNHSPKAKPPVAAKPPAHKWLTMHMVKSSSVSSHFSETPPASERESQGVTVKDMAKVERREKPKRWHQPPRCASDGVMVQRPLAEEAHSYVVADPFCHLETREVRRTTHLHVELDNKKKPVPPPVAKKPDVVFLPPVTSIEQESSRSHVWSGPSAAYQCPASVDQSSTRAYQPSASMYQSSASAYQSPANAYQSTTSSYQDRDFIEQEHNHHRIKYGYFSDENCEEARMVSEMRTLCLTEQEEEDFDHTSSQPSTEDLFAIIHRSKKKLLGRKEAADTAGSRQGYGSPVKGNQGMLQKSTSKNDNFMAFLQRRRSNKASSGERLSAAELLRSTKPLAGQP